MLRACLTPLGKTHASEKSYNNHWGVPLTLARMPADTKYAVFEIGMNHAGEITPLTKMVRPHVAIVTTVAAVHLEHFATVEKIAEAKAEIFAGLESSGTAIIPADNPYTKILVDEAEALGARVVTFGTIAAADFRRSGVEHGQSGTGFTARGNAPELGVFEFAVRLETFGQHMVRNALAVAAALTSIDQKPATAMIPLANFKAPGGRGSRTKMAVNGGNVLVIDESYNANPASMRAALETTALTSRATHPRRIAVLGDMLELGEQSESLHKALAEPIEQAGVDLVFAAGPNMKHLYDVLPLAKRAKDGWAPTAAGIEAALLATVRAGDVVMIKGSNGSRMAPLVAALIARHTPATVST